MRLLLVNPNTNRATTAAMQRIAQGAAPAGVAVKGATVTQGAPLLLDEMLLAAGAAATEALLRGMDVSAFAGVILAAFGDPGLAACRAFLPLPVTGIAEAAMAEAAAFGRFAIVTTTPALVGTIEGLATRYGHAERYAGTWIAPGDLTELMARPKLLKAALGAAIEQARAAVSPAAVIIGGGPLASAAADLRRHLQIAIVEPVPAAVRLALKRASSVSG